MGLTAHVLNPSEPLKALFGQGPVDPGQGLEPAVRGVTRLNHVQRRLSAEQIVALARQYERGATVQQLVRSFRIDRSTVLGHLERQGVPRRPNTRNLTDQQVEEACQLYGRGESTLTLGRRFGVDPETVRRALERNGIRRRQRPGR